MESVLSLSPTTQTKHCQHPLARSTTMNNRIMMAAISLLLMLLTSCSTSSAFGLIGRGARAGANGIGSLFASTPADKAVEKAEKTNKAPLNEANKELKAAKDEETMVIKKSGKESPEAAVCRNNVVIAELKVTQATVDYLRKQIVVADKAEKEIDKVVSTSEGEDKSKAIEQWNKVNSKKEGYDKQINDAAIAYGKLLNSLPASFTGTTEIVVDKEDDVKLDPSDPRLTPFRVPAEAKKLATEAEGKKAETPATPKAPSPAVQKPSESAPTPVNAPASSPVSAVAPSTITEAAGNPPAASAAGTVTSPSNTTPPSDTTSVGGSGNEGKDARSEEVDSAPLVAASSEVKGTLPPSNNPPSPPTGESESSWSAYPWLLGLGIIAALLFFVRRKRVAKSPIGLVGQKEKVA